MQADRKENGVLQKKLENEKIVHLERINLNRVKTMMQGCDAGKECLDFLEKEKCEVVSEEVKGKAALNFEKKKITLSPFLSEESAGQTGNDPALKLEFETTPLTRVSLLVVNSESLPEAVEWAQGKADILVIDGVVYGSRGGLSVKGCDLSALAPDDEYAAFRTLVDEGFAESGGKGWILCGTMNHYSMMQGGYPDTPQWYPTDATSEVFRSDRYAWQNNLYDLLWMQKRGFVTTWTDTQNHAWQADYVYASPVLLRQVAEIERMERPLADMKHNPIRVTFRL